MRLSEEVRESEQATNTKRRRITRLSKEVKEREQSADTERKREERKLPQEEENSILKFKEVVHEGPIYICTSCNRLLFKTSVVKFNK